VTSRRAQRRDQPPAPIEVPVPPGHPWGCPTCQVTVAMVARRVLFIAHDNDCPTWQSIVRALNPGEGDAVVAVPGNPDDIKTLLPSW
jgi:hypothetical protein